MTAQTAFDFNADAACLPSLSDYDIIMVSTSGGKDSQAMLSYICDLAEAEGVRDRVQAVHADLGEMEWGGCPELAAEQAEFYGVPFHVVQRSQGDILEHVLTKHANNVKRGKERPPWPGYQIRDCTSDHKRGQIWTAYTKVVREWNAARRAAGKAKRPCKVLDCQGLRAEESRKRERQPGLAYNKGASNKNKTEAWVLEHGVRAVYTWLPIQDWSTEQVWERINADGAPHHWAYDIGMPRLSCCFCFYAVLSVKGAPKAAVDQTLWLLAGYHNRALLDRYIAVEAETGYTYVQGFEMTELRTVLDAGWEPPRAAALADLRFEFCD
jgi:3'-phosphoadenosine 5'-phosphosulfate sulfotransferase (PAPS reductase)/FAD synthetase